MRRLVASPGDRFGNFTYISSLGSRSTVYKSGHFIKNKFNVYWLCRCICGALKELKATSVVNGRVKSCGCVRKRPPPILPSGHAMSNHMWNAYRQNARRRDLQFELTKDDFRHLSSRDCHYCGAPPSSVCLVYYSEYSKECPGQPRSTPYMWNGIDRVDNNLGYTMDNCVPCCSICNYMKKAMTFVEFILHINKIAAMHTA